MSLKGLQEYGYHALTSLVVSAIQPPTTTSDPPTYQAIVEQTIMQPSTRPVSSVRMSSVLFYPNP
jgi:hypothetical protein